jgi:hypothetical protein
MDKQQHKTRWKLNVFDIILIAVILAAAAAVFLLWRSSGANGGTTVTARQVRYTIELEEMVGDTAYAIHEGDTIVDSTKKYVMGTVASVTVVPATDKKTDLTTGDTVTVEIPGENAAVIELLCDCNETATEITAVSGYVVRIGAEVQAAGPGYAGTGFIIAIEREADAQ